MNGWIKLHRELINKPIWQCSTPEQKVILITLLMMANHEHNEWEWMGERYVCQPGQFVTSLESITKASGIGISVRNVRTALDRFKKYEFLTSQSTNKNRLVTITNWDTYQGKEDEPDKQTVSQLTGNRQTTDRQLTTNKNDKNDKNIKNRGIFEIDSEDQSTEKPKKEPKKSKSDVVDLSFIEDQEYVKLIKKWLSYKKTKGQAYKDIESIKLLYENLHELSSGKIENATVIVNKSMSNNWSGIFPLKDGDLKKYQNNKSNQTYNDDVWDKETA